MFAVVDQQGSEALNPAVDPDVISVDTALDEELFDVSERHAVAEVPAHSQHDDLGRKPTAGERRMIDGQRLLAVMAHSGTLAGRRVDPSTQQLVPSCLRRRPSAQLLDVGVEPAKVGVRHVDDRLVHERVHMDVLGRHQHDRI